jgi:hypothetical protein
VTRARSSCHGRFNGLTLQRKYMIAYRKRLLGRISHFVAGQERFRSVIFYDRRLADGFGRPSPYNTAPLLPGLLPSRAVCP